MNKISLILAVIALALVIPSRPQKVEAQAAQAFTMSGSAAHTTCLTPAATAYYLCVASDGIFVSNAGAAYFQIVAPAAGTTPTLTLNGTTKTLPASFTITATGPTVTIGAPTVGSTSIAAN